MPTVATLPARPATREHATTPTAPVADGTIVVATLGRTETDAAVRFGAALGAHRGVSVRLVAACERDDVLPALHAQVRRVSIDGARLPITLLPESSTDAIARTATACRAGALVLGRGRLIAPDGGISAATALRLLRRIDVPVFAIAADAAALPTRVVVAMDFGAHGIEAARVALRFVAPDATVTLAHVLATGQADAPAERAVPRLFDAVLAQLEVPCGVRVATATLAGPSVGQAIVEFAARTGADLVVASTHGHGLLARLVVGGIAARLLRTARCSVLCVPASAPTDAPALRRESIPPSEWAAALRALGGRYAGGRCLLALADAYGVTCERFRALPLAGLAYDPAAAAVVVAFGASPWSGTGEPSGLVHTAREIVAIDRLVDVDGTVRALHVVGTSAEAVLSFA